WNLARERQPGRPVVHVYTPRFDVDGWQSTHTVVEIVDDDMPFLVDSVSMELNRHGLGIHLVIHPTMNVRRDDAGQMIDVVDDEMDATGREAFIHVEVDRETDRDVLDTIDRDIRRVVGDVRAAR